MEITDMQKCIHFPGKYVNIPYSNLLFYECFILFSVFVFSFDVLSLEIE